MSNKELEMIIGWFENIRNTAAKYKELNYPDNVGLNTIFVQCKDCIEYINTWMIKKQNPTTKLKTFMRLCNEATKRSVALKKVSVLDSRHERWRKVYEYKLNQAAAVGDSIRGDEAYYSIVSAANIVLDGSKETDDNAKIIDAVLNEARRVLIQLNQ